MMMKGGWGKVLNRNNVRRSIQDAGGETEVGVSGVKEKKPKGRESVRKR